MRRNEPALAMTLLLLALNSFNGCRKDADSQKDYRNQYLVNGHIIVKGADLGVPSEAAFRAALNDSLSGRQISPGFLLALRDVGQLYCWEKKEHPEKSDPDLVQVTTAEFHNHYKPHNADEVVDLDVAAALAEKTWCPMGLPNPVTKPPEFPANGYQ